MGCLFSIIGSLVEPICGKLKEEAAYICNYKTSIRTLKDELPRLEAIKADVEAKVEADKRQGRLIAHSVHLWLSNVEKLLQDCRQDVLVEDEGWKLCVWQVPNLIYWYTKGKKAQKMIEGVTRLIEQKFDYISLEAPPPRLCSMFAETEELFESRRLIMNQIIHALKDRQVQRIVLCGMGGVGKTTMVRKLIKYAEEHNLFDRVVMAVVSQNPEPRKIQGEIAGSLKLTLNSESVEGRKGELHVGTKEIQELLVVLDDVWTKLDFDSIGLPFDNRKIVITSRSDLACRPVRTDKCFTISLLSPDESWNLFKQKAGDVVDRPHIRATAKEISAECCCLPLAVVTLARVLGAREQKFVWEDALEKLRNSPASSFAEMNECVFSRIQLSYDFLQDEDMKSCFLLCSLFPEDFDIPIELLLRYGLGMGYFRNFDTILKARKHVHSLVLDLKRCHLLLESDKLECVKVHDVVLDTAKFIAQRDRKFISTTRKWPEEDKWRSSTALALNSLSKIETYPTCVDCAQLRLLHITSEKKSESIQDSFFRSIGQVMVLSLHNFSFVPSVPLPFQKLQNVRSLRLEGCKLGKVSIIGSLMKRLEVLSFRQSTIEELPREIGELNQLRLLDLTGCYDLKRIPFGVLSSLLQLEELYLGKVGFHWDEALEENASLNELKSMSRRLKVFHTSIRRLDSLPKDLHFECIESFKIGIGSSLFGGEWRVYVGPNLLRLHHLNNYDAMNSLAIQQFLKKSEVLKLDEVSHLKVVVNELDDVGFQALDDLSIESCKDVEYVLDESSCQNVALPRLKSLSLKYLPNLKEIVCTDNGNGELAHNGEWQSFGSLTSLNLDKCTMLNSIFSPSATTRGKLFTSTWLHRLPNLEILEINFCPSIDTVFDFNGSSVDMEIQQAATLMTRVKIIKLGNMLGLLHIWSGNVPLGLPGFQNLTELRVSHCHLLSYIFPTSIVPLISNLRRLKVSHCRMLETIVDGLEEAGVIHFSQLNEMFLYDLPKLVAVCADRNELLLPSHTELTICHCYLLKNIPFKCHSIGRPTDEINNFLSAPSDHGKSKEVFMAEEVQYDIIGGCPTLKIAAQYNNSLDVMFCFEQSDFNNLKELHLNSLPRLKHIWSTGALKGLQNLTYLFICDCHILQFALPPIEKLVSLERLTIARCKLLERVVHSEGKVERAVCAFPRLRSVLLSELKNFVPLCQQALDWHFLEEVSIEDLSGFNAFSSSSPLVEDTLKIDVRPSSDKGVTSSVFNPIMEETSKASAKCIPFVSIEMLQHMHELKLEKVDEVVVVFELQSLRHPNGICCFLDRMELRLLPNLECIWKTGPQEIRGFNNLQYLKLFRCDSLRGLMSSSISKLLSRLKELEVQQCSKLEVVVENGEENTSIISFPQLRTVSLGHLTSLVSFCRSPCNLQLPAVQEFAVSGCPGFVADMGLSQLEGCRRNR